MMNPVPWLQMTNMISYQGLVRTFPSSNNVLISDHFYYFGNKAIEVDLDSIEYHRIRNYKKIPLNSTIPAIDLIKKIEFDFRSDKNSVISDPCNFSDFYKRVDQGTGELY